MLPYVRLCNIRWWLIVELMTGLQFTGSQESVVNMGLDIPIITGLRASIRRSFRNSIRRPQRNHAVVLSAPSSPPSPRIGAVSHLIDSLSTQFISSPFIDGIRLLPVMQHPLHLRDVTGPGRDQDQQRWKATIEIDLCYQPPLSNQLIPIPPAWYNMMIIPVGTYIETYFLFFFNLIFIFYFNFFFF